MIYAGIYMKIIFILPSMAGGGSERVVANLVNFYVNKGLEAAILMFASNEVTYELDSRVEVVQVGTKTNGNPLERIKRIKNMRKYFKQNEGCFIFSFNEMGAVFSVIAAMGIKHRLLVSERNDPRRIPFIQRVLRDWAYAKADCMVAQTEDVVRMFSKKVQSKSVVIPNPISGDIPERHIGERTKRIVNVARLEPQKNHELLMNAFSDFCVTHNDYTLDIYGKGSLLSSLKERALELQISDKVIFHGFSSDVKNEIRDASMFVLSSDYEGISNSMVESLAMGIPTISTDCPVGGSKTFIQNGANGLLVPVGDVVAMTEAMCRIADDNELAQKFSDNSISIRTTCSIDKIATDFLKAAGID